jgi:putative flippase GtrA
MNIVIPAYEPDEKLISLIHSIQGNCDYKIIIVNDGSSSPCNKIFQSAKDLGCTVLVHKNNQGKGAALKTAFSHLISRNEQEGVVCADCDGQHNWQDIIKIANAVPLHPDSIILGRRKFVGKVPLKSLLGNKITSFIYFLVLHDKVLDTQTGLRGFSAHMLPWLINLKGNRYEYEMNQLLEAKSAGFKLYSVQIQTIYENNNEGSHFRPIKDSIRIYLPIIRFALSSISCGIIDFIVLFILNSITHNLLVSVIAARVVSSLCNYILNKNIVFQNNSQSHVSSIIKYYALVVLILGINYMLMGFFVNVIGLSLLVGKLLTECMLYALSYFIQHRVVFKS